MTKSQEVFLNSIPLFILFKTPTLQKLMRGLKIDDDVIGTKRFFSLLLIIPLHHLLSPSNSSPNKFTKWFLQWQDLNNLKNSFQDMPLSLEILRSQVKQMLLVPLFLCKKVTLIKFRLPSFDLYLAGRGTSLS